MNKQELIKEYEGAPFSVVSINGVLEDLKQLDEPQKPVVPRFVADWIKYCKRTGVELQHALNMEDLYFYNYANKKDGLKLKEFFETENNQDLFARAWLDGFEIEKEKRYFVKVKGVCFNSCLIFEKKNKKWFFSSIYEIDHQRGYHTRKQLEQAGFDWVFDCEGIEIEEVEE